MDREHVREAIDPFLSPRRFRIFEASWYDLESQFSFVSGQPVRLFGTSQRMTAARHKVNPLEEVSHRVSLSEIAGKIGGYPLTHTIGSTRATSLARPAWTAASTTLVTSL